MFASSVTTVKATIEPTGSVRRIEFLWTARSEISAREGLDMAYEQLPIVDVDLNGLLLDLDNYRIPTHRDDEAAALKYLFASEDVLGGGDVSSVMVASTTRSRGGLDREGSADKPPYIVLEGNRRVSALKALQDPSVVPGHETELRALLKRYAVEAENLPKRIRVLVAPDRATAAPHVARLHTGISKRR